MFLVETHFGKFVTDASPEQLQRRSRELLRDYMQEHNTSLSGAMARGFRYVWSPVRYTGTHAPKPPYGQK